MDNNDELREQMLSIRRSLLVETRWIEKHIENGYDLPEFFKDYLEIARRSRLQTVRQIENNYGIKTKRKKPRKRR